ncbi:MAG TPA: hypothetical protein VGQ36_07780 [Thermoanaerobaculia bacterium]|jgi:hypothetical protein|nr:hypothetical protein [Thermoanaerobaculia bacterium]
MPRSVAIVFAEDYSGQLEKLAFHTPVWLIDTPDNRTAAEETWRTAVEWPHITVTLFREDDWTILIELISLRERFDVVEAIGTALTPHVREAIEAAGFVRVEETATGFRARR